MKPIARCHAATPFACAPAWVGPTCRLRVLPLGRPPGFVSLASARATDSLDRPTRNDCTRLPTMLDTEITRKLGIRIPVIQGGSPSRVDESPG